MNLVERKTYVFVDVSNIRYACLRSCHFNLDFIKLYNYFRKKYPSLQDVRYYEGIADNDMKKAEHFEFLQSEIGYTVCALTRRTYVDPPLVKSYTCEKCHTRNLIQLSPRTIKMKSNVDVYLASDMIECAVLAKEPIHIILVSCDGDYAEAINTVLRLNSTVHVTILATPRTRANNSLSQRLQVFANRSSERTTLTSIATIKNRISQPYREA